jgi:beta-glucosidase
LQAWYPGSSGGEAIANLLFGQVNPSGRLPITFPKDESQLPRAALVEKDAQGKPTLEVHYKEGATVGYKWMDAKKSEPLFPFGFGLSYTSFGVQRSRSANRRSGPGGAFQGQESRQARWERRAAGVRVAHRR